MDVRSHSTIRSKLSICIYLFILSFLIRLMLLIPAVLWNVQPIYDEKQYYSRAVGFENVFNDLLHGHRPSSEHLYYAYGKGTWPPLHQLILGSGLFVFGESLCTARVIVSIFSAASSVLLYLLTIRISTDRVARITSYLHIFSPVFLLYSHYLWSETTFIFLLLCALYFTIALLQQQRGILHAILIGSFIGLCGLARSAGLGLFVAIPLLLAFFLKAKSARLILPMVTLISSVLIILPWESALMFTEKRFVILSTSGGSALFYGNNPWYSERYAISQVKREEAVQEYSRRLSIDKDIAARKLAIREVRSNFGLFLSRCIVRVGRLWTVDAIPLRHLFVIIYPPMPMPIAVAITAILFASHFLLLILAIIGILNNQSVIKFRSVLLIFSAVLLSLPIIAGGVTRYSLPSWSLLLPFAGYGTTILVDKRTSYSRLLLMVILLAVSLNFLATLNFVRTFFVPSSFYGSILGQVDSIFHIKSPYSDQILFKDERTESTAPVDFQISNNGFVFGSSQKNFYRWSSSDENALLILSIDSPVYIGHPELVVTSGSQRSIIHPIATGNWRRWQPSGIKGIEYFWVGGGEPPLTKANQESGFVEYK